MDFIVNKLRLTPMDTTAHKRSGPSNAIQIMRSFGIWERPLSATQLQHNLAVRHVMYVCQSEKWPPKSAKDSNSCHRERITVSHPYSEVKKLSASASATQELRNYKR